MRQFFNVGNGLFAIEEIFGKKIVYDCGGKGIEQAVDRALGKERDDIEAVFISHFDSDHINGIHYLLKHHNVKRLILPLLDFSLRIFLFSEKLTWEELELIYNTEDYINRISKDTEIIYVRAGNNGETNIRSSMTIEQLPSKIASGQKINIDDHSNWILIPWYLQTFDKYELKDLVEKVLANSQYKEIRDREWNIKNLWEEHNIQKMSAIKNALINCVGNLTVDNINESSLTVYSGPYPPALDNCKCGCLYLGDYNASKFMGELKDAYKDVWDTVGIVQIPHHGSIYNYSHELINNNTLAIISVCVPTPSVKLENIGHLIAIKGGIPLFTSTKGDIEINKYAKWLFTDSIIDCMLCYSKYGL